MPTTTPAEWSAQQYLAFEDERSRPVRDLLSALPGIAAETAVDIGCGPGNSTELLMARFPGAVVSGLDSSQDMIAAARKRLPEVQFTLGDIEGWLTAGRGSFDVILANAVLQWVPDHERWLPLLTARLAPGGVLAVQMPDNLDEPAHRLMRAVALDGPWAARLVAVAATRAAIGSSAWYYGMLRSTGCRVDIWRTTYHHALAGGAAAVVEWFKGSGLRPFLAPLDADERAEFLRRYEAAVAGAYPAMSDGTVLLPFPRMFMVAVR
jgi:trans-aconitate 2-methyltransferase